MWERYGTSLYSGLLRRGALMVVFRGIRMVVENTVLVMLYCTRPLGVTHEYGMSSGSVTWNGNLCFPAGSVSGVYNPMVPLISTIWGNEQSIHIIHYSINNRHVIFPISYTDVVPTIR